MKQGQASILPKAPRHKRANEAQPSPMPRSIDFLLRLFLALRCAARVANGGRKPSVGFISLACLSAVSASTSSPSPAVEPPISFSSLSSADAFLLDSTSSPAAMYVWIGAQSSLTERRLAVEYAQKYLHDKFSGSDSTRKRRALATPIVKMQEGHESEAFLKILGAER